MFEHPRPAPSPPDSPSTPCPDGNTSGTLSNSTSCFSMKKPSNIPQRVSDALNEKGFNVDSDGVVTWQPESRSHPRQWPILRKTYGTSLICFLEFFMVCGLLSHALSAFETLC